MRELKTQVADVTADALELAAIRTGRSVASLVRAALEVAGYPVPPLRKPGRPVREKVVKIEGGVV
jgi:hypothetical protein